MIQTVICFVIVILDMASTYLLSRLAAASEAALDAHAADWSDSGAPDLLEQARQKTRELLAEPPPQHIPAEAG